MSTIPPADADPTAAAPTVDVGSDAPVTRPRRRSAIVVHAPPPVSLDEEAESTLPTFAMPAAYDSDDGAERLSRFRRNPAVLVGAGVTAGVLGAGLLAFNRGDSLWSQRLMRMRVVAQVGWSARRRAGLLEWWQRLWVGGGVCGLAALVSVWPSPRRRVGSMWVSRMMAPLLYSTNTNGACLSWLFSLLFKRHRSFLVRRICWARRLSQAATVGILLASVQGAKWLEGDSAPAPRPPPPVDAPAPGTTP